MMNAVRVSHLATKICLSGFILFHVLVIFTVPNAYSMMARQLWPIISPYASQLGINTGWQFFSPAPTPATYLKYTVIGGKTMNSPDHNMDENYYFPITGSGPSYGPNESRYLGAMRFFTYYPERLVNVLVPYLCQKHPGALKLNIEHIMEFKPQPEAVIYGHSYMEVIQKLRMRDITADCPQQGSSS